MSIPPPGPPTGPPPGWYPDPYGQPGYRWWDGSIWTDHHSAPDQQPDGALLSVGDLLTETFRMLGQRLGPLFTLAAVLLLGPGVLASASVYALVDGILYQDGTWSGVGAGRVGLVAAALAATIAAHLVFTGAVNRQGMAALQGAPEPWSTSLAGGLRRAPRVLGANLAVWLPAVLIAAALVVVGAALGPAPALLAVLGVLVGLLVVWVRAGLLTTAAAVAPPGTGAVGTALGLTRGRFWAFLGRYLLLAMLWWAVNTGGSIATGPVAGFASDPPDDAVLVDDDTGEVLRVDVGALLPDNPGVVGFSLVVTGLVQAAASSVTSLARVSLYRSAGGLIDEGLSPPDPEPA